MENVNEKPKFIITFPDSVPSDYKISENLPDDYDEKTLRDGMIITMKDGRKATVEELEYPMEEQYTTNVIEIKPDKRYMFILETDGQLSQDAIDHIKSVISRTLEDKGLTDSFALVLASGLKAKALEMDKKEEPDPNGDDEPDGTEITRP